MDYFVSQTAYRSNGKGEKPVGATAPTSAAVKGITLLKRDLDT
ncbi:hypothetical protein [Moorena producens]|nr:hypothetical protein [Moorena producens]